MNEQNWYDDMDVERVVENGKLKHIDVVAPNASGNYRRVRVYPGSTNEFLADLIYGLKYELDRVEENKRVENELELEVH